MALTQTTRAAVYLRISQDRTGLQAGIQRQQEDCAAHAAKLGFTDPQEFIDNDVSAFDGGRRNGYDAWGRACSVFQPHPAGENVSITTPTRSSPRVLPGSVEPWPQSTSTTTSTKDGWLTTRSMNSIATDHGSRPIRFS
ncbi:recombinase family protein [Microbacterium aquimaris]|uniref:recombinase family protein n=1 Tax=Microbacterium aquimaris TaxID=459816 RepID=UPI00390698B4